MKLLQNGNSKLKHTAKVNNCLTFTWSLSPMVTCPMADICKSYCYASCIEKPRKNVRECYQRNTELSKAVYFVPSMILELTGIQTKAKGKPIVIRLHDSGDFYSPDYVNKWREIVAMFPNITFYCYSKSHRWLTDMPSNFFCIPSLGGKDDHLLEGKPHAKVVPEGYNLKPGEVFGSEDEISNLYSVVVDKKVLCLVAHGARRKQVR